MVVPAATVAPAIRAETPAVAPPARTKRIAAATTTLRDRVVSLRAVALLFLLVVPISLAAGETVTSVTLDSGLALARVSEAAAVSAVTTGVLDVSAAASRNVRAQLQLKTTVGDGSALTVPRAYVKVRLPWFRFMIGKNRVSFGRGFFFDAGDVIFGGAGLLVSDFSAAVLRDDTAWLAEAYLPLGDFSYLEGVLLPYLGPGGVFGSPASTALVQDLAQLLVPVNWQNLSGGGRIVARLVNVDLEAGYLFRGAGGLHLPYLGAAGSLFVDWYLAASATLPASELDWQNTNKRIAISWGLFHLFQLEGDASVAARMEGLVLPGGQWKEVAGGLTSPVVPPMVPAVGKAAWSNASEVDFTFTSRYGLYLYPEIDYAPSQSLAFQLRSIVSPIDASASLLSGVSWNVYQGLTLRTYLFAMLGADTATFGWNQPGGLGGALSAEFVF